MTVALINLLATILPTATNLILTLIHPDGSSTVLVLAKVDAADAANLAELQKLQGMIGTATTTKPAS